MKRQIKAAGIIVIYLQLAFISTGSIIADETGSIDKNLISKYHSRVVKSDNLQSTINIFTNNSIKDLSLNREELISHDKFMNVKLETTKITNQKSSGRCWMYAGANVFAPRIKEKFKLDDFEMSESYLAFWDKMEKANLFLEQIIDTRDLPLEDRKLQSFLGSPFGDGGWWHFFTGLVEKYGVVPQSAMPETKQSSSTGSVNFLATTLLRKCAAEIRQMHTDGVAVKELRTRKEEVLSDIYRLLVYTYGVPPEKFTFRFESKDSTVDATTQEYTPINFAKELFAVTEKEYAGLIDNPAREYDRLYQLESSRNLVEKTDLTILNFKPEKLRNYTLASLLDSQAVWFACDVGRQNYRSKGIMADGIYDYGNTCGIDFSLSKADRISFKEIVPGHAMTIVGVDTTDSGDPVKWLVKNSWGTDRGDDGYWYMYNDWFDQFVFMVIIDKELLEKDDRKKLDQTPEIIPSWDHFFLALRNLN